MDIQSITKEALEKAYKDQIGKLFNVYLNAVITQEGSVEGSGTAKERFKAGLQVTQKAFTETMEITDIK